MTKISDEVIKELNWVSPHTRDLWISTYTGKNPDSSTLEKFGVQTSDQLNALIWVITNEKVAPTQLDAAMGDGEELTRLVLRREQPYQVTFYSGEK